MTSRARTAKGRRAGGLTEHEVPDPVRQLPGAHRAFRSASGCNAIVSREPTQAAPAAIWLPPQAQLLWHLSISHRHRYPDWDEIADLRYALCPPDVTMAMLLPPPGEYINAHEFCFHLWQIEDRRAE